ncbi:hypothetical protein AB0G54_41985 [Streptomyces yokosukanensis]|uniref:hypothetical protein n=1 Tax=Streptomyces yokosukanensis TaxID=67386 RepID=UPI00343D66E5
MRAHTSRIRRVAIAVCSAPILALAAGAGVASAATTAAPTNVVADHGGGGWGDHGGGGWGDGGWGGGWGWGDHGGGGGWGWGWGWGGGGWGGDNCD